MGLPIAVEKIEDAHHYVLYAFGPPQAPVGRVRLYPDSGDIELARLSETESEPDARYYLAQVVPRLQSYHDRDTYPDSDQWDI